VCVVCCGRRAGSSESEDGHQVVATARAVFSSEGGVLESKETGLS